MWRPLNRGERDGRGCRGHGDLGRHPQRQRNPRCLGAAGRSLPRVTPGQICLWELATSLEVTVRGGWGTSLLRASGVGYGFPGSEGPPSLLSHVGLLQAPAACHLPRLPAWPVLQAPWPVVGTASPGVPVGAALNPTLLHTLALTPRPLWLQATLTSWPLLASTGHGLAPPGVTSALQKWPLSPQAPGHHPGREGHVSTLQGGQPGGRAPSTAASPGPGEVRPCVQYFPSLASSSGTLGEGGKCWEAF